MTSSVDLVNVFQGVVGALQENKQTLNEADEYNHNHGDNMVQIFERATKALSEKKDAAPAEKLAHASELVQGIDSGSAQVYARGLAQAAQEFRGKKLTSENATLLLKNLLNAGDPPEQQPQERKGLLGSIVSEFTGGGEGEEEGLEVDDLLNAGLTFLQSKQSGDSNTEALMDALVSSSSVGQVPHRAQSGRVVAETLIGMLGSP